MSFSLSVVSSVASGQKLQRILLTDTDVGNAIPLGLETLFFLYASAFLIHKIDMQFSVT